MRSSRRAHMERLERACATPAAPIAVALTCHFVETDHGSNRDHFVICLELSDLPPESSPSVALQHRRGLPAGHPNDVLLMHPALQHHVTGGPPEGVRPQACY